MHEKCELIEKEGLKETYQDKKTKTLERLRQKTKNKSIYIYILDQMRRESVEKF